MKAAFDWSDVVQKKAKKLNAAVLLLFVAGALLFTVPVITELFSYRADEDAYEAMAIQIRPPEASPGPVLLTAEAIPVPTEEPAATQLPLLVPNAADASDTEQLPTELPDAGQLSTEPPVTEQSPAPVASDLPADAAELTPSPLPLPSAELTVLPEYRPTAKPIAATPVPAQQNKPTAALQTTATPRPGVDLTACVAQNRDFVAWLSIPGTVIDYPVVRSDNTEYYLHHMFSGKESKLGTLFSLTSSDYRTPSKNIAIYGHHLSQSNAMFSTLMVFKDPSYCAGHRMITLDSLYGRREYRIFAVLNMDVSEWDAATASFSNESSFLHFINRAKQQALYDTGIQVSADDHILTLITCDRSYGGAGGRLIVMAVQQ